MTERLVPGSASPLEVTIDETLEPLFTSIPTPIAEATRALEAPAEFLPFLAWGAGVDVWRPDWPEIIQRERIERSIEIDRLHGTFAGINAEVSFTSGEILSYVVPPADFFLSGDQAETDALYRAWLEGLPEIRLYEVRDFGNEAGYLADTGSEDEFTPGCFLSGDLEEDAVFFLDGPPAAAERATIVRDGVERDISCFRQPDVRRGRFGDVYLFALEADAGAGFFLDDGFLNDDVFLGGVAEATAELTVAFGYPENPDGEIWNLVVPSFRVQDVVPEIRAVVKTDQVGFYLDDSFLDDDAFLGGLDVDVGTFRSIRIIEGDVPTFSAGSFLDADRLGMPPYTAELLVRVNEGSSPDLMFLDADYLDDGFLDKEPSTEALDFVCEAVTAGKALRDTVLLDLDIPTRRSLKRARSFSDLTLR